MKREELIERLKEANASGRLLEAVEEVFEYHRLHGTHMHDPEFWECAGCGGTIELPTNGNERGAGERNPLCTACQWGGR